MHSHIPLLKDGVLKEISDFCEVKEKIEATDEKMIVKVKNTNIMYRAFNETKEEHSRVHFLKSDRFPDSIFLSIEPDGKIHCHICELKRTPANKLKELTEQLFSGYMHSKLLLSALHINSSKVVYSYHVFMINERNKEVEYNKLPNRPKKVTPGRRIEKVSRYDTWMNNYLTFVDGTFNHKMYIYKHREYNQKENNYYYHFEL